MDSANRPPRGGSNLSSEATAAAGTTARAETTATSETPATVAPTLGAQAAPTLGTEAAPTVTATRRIPARTPTAYVAAVKEGKVRAVAPSRAAPTFNAKGTRPAALGKEVLGLAKQAFRDQLSHAKAWAVDLQVHKLQHEAQRGPRRGPPPPAEAEPDAIDPDDLPSPRNPFCTVREMRRMAAWNASPAGIAWNERMAVKDREYAEYKTAQAAEAERQAALRATLAREEAEAEAAANRPPHTDHGQADNAPTGRLIPTARGYQLGLNWRLP